MTTIATTAALRHAGRSWTPRDESLLLRNRRSRRIAGWTAAGLAMLGVAVGLASLLRPAPPPYLFFVAPSTFGDVQGGADVAIGRDRQALIDGGYFRPPAEGGAAKAGRQADALVELSACRRTDIVVIYVSGRATVDADGKIVLFPGDECDGAAAQLPLADLLDRVRNCPARRKLLVLDIVRAGGNLIGGIESEEVACLIPGVLEAAPDPDRLTLLSCAPGQASLDSEIFHRTGFGYYFELGIRGGADDFNDAHQADGRVSVHELARFLARRVDRWARTTHGLRQTPVLFGKRDDFDLIAISARERREFQGEIADLALAQYPKWMLEAWKQCDGLRSSGVLHRQPRLFRQFESAVLAAERQWRSGGETASARQQLQTELALLKRRIDKAEAATPQPQPPSLAQLEHDGHTADPAVAAQLDTLVMQVQAIPPETPPPAAAGQVAAQVAAAIDKFSQATAKASADDVAMAALDTLYRDRSPSPATVRLLDRVIGQRQPQPRYVETHFLRRLVEVAGSTPETAWPTDAVRLGLRVLRMSQQAACADRPFAWTASLLTAAEQARHNGDTLLLAPGYAPPQEALHWLQQAERGDQGVLAYHATLREAYDALDEARLRLPQYTRYLEFDAASETAWCVAVAAACELDAVLQLDPSQPSPAADELGKLVERIREHAAQLSAALAQLEQPWQPEHIAEVRRRAQSGLDAAAAAHAMRALLDVPWLPAEQRVGLWRTLRDVNQRLHRQVVAWDAGRLPAPDESEVSQPLPESEVAQRVAQRIGWAVELLQLGGCPRQQIDALQQQAATLSSGPKSSPSTRRQMIAEISAAYARLVQDTLHDSDSPAAQARVSAIVPADNRVAALDDPAASPFTKLHRAYCKQRWKWLAGHYNYLAHDICGAAFNAEIARRYLALVGAGVELPFVLIQAPDALPSLSAEQPVQIAHASWKLVTPQSSQQNESNQPPPAPDISVLSPTDRLQVVVESSAANQGGDMRLRFVLDPAAESDSSAPTRGVMLRVELLGRTYHRAIDLPALAAGPQLQVLLSADPVNPPALPTAPLSRLRLRPAEQPQPYYLYVSNPTNSDAEVVVDVSTAARPSPPLKLPAGGVQRVVFPPQAPKPGQPLPQLDGALVVRVLDAKTQQPLAERRFPIDVVSPRQYVRVDGSQFVPHDSGKNRLTVSLRAFEMPPGPPCIVELALSPDEIPGLEGITSGMLRGELPADGSPLVLAAENLLLADGYDEAGAFCLAVDGVPRTFRFAATFARRGDPTTPRELLQPRVQLTADEYARSAPGFSASVHVENAADGSRLQLELGRVRGGVFTPDLTRSTNRTRVPHVAVNPGGPAGELQFFVSLDDWRVQLDTTGIVGRRQLRAQLFDPLGAVSRVATRDVILDDTPPRSVAFLQSPVQAALNQPIDFVVQALDDISGVQEVNLFLGKPSDGKPPGDAKLIAAKPLNRSGTQWQVQIPGQQQAGPIDVTAQATNRVGLSTLVTTSLSIVDKASSAADTSSGIAGQVLEGGRPQPGLPVTLSDATGAVQGSGTTDAQGAFRFDKLKPGKYTVSAVKASSQRKGASQVDVQPGQTANVSIDLSL